MSVSSAPVSKRPPAWLLSLGGVVVAAVGGAFLYALWIACANLARIGV
jgi:hypothetical protein